MLELILPWLLVAQGVIGGTDTLLNHELIERLPYRVAARGEIALHAAREFIYGTLFVGLAWFSWHGSAALVIAGLLVVEVVVSTTDEYVENRIRVMPQNERVLHVFLILNLGLITAVLVPVLWTWSTLPTALVRHDQGALPVVLTALGVASLAWSVRDALAWRRLHGDAASMQAAA